MAYVQRVIPAASRESRKLVNPAFYILRCVLTTRLFVCARAAIVFSRGNRAALKNHAHTVFIITARFECVRIFLYLRPVPRYLLTSHHIAITDLSPR